VFDRSALIPVRLMMGVTTRSSVCMKFARSCVEPPMGSMKAAWSLAFTSGIARMVLISRFMRCTMAPGVLLGAISAIQARFSIPGRPASFIVGISGISALRWAVDTASARSLPLLTCGMTATPGTQANCTSPCSTASTDSGEDAYGMCTANVSVLTVSSSTPSCDRLPTPVDEK